MNSKFHERVLHISSSLIFFREVSSNRYPAMKAAPIFVGYVEGYCVT